MCSSCFARSKNISVCNIYNVVLATDNVSGMLFQSNHRLATRMQRRLHGRALDIHIRPLNEDKAIQSAVDLLGELFIFSASVLDLHALSEINIHRSLTVSCNYMEQLKIPTTI
jgi:hypothetical protein